MKREKRKLKKGPMKIMGEKPRKKKFKDTTFGKELIKLWNDLKPMTWNQRFDHIWTYYKEYIGLIALLIFVCTGLITSTIAAQRESVVTGIMVNVTVSQEGFNYLSTDYAEYLGVGKDKDVKLEYTSFLDLEKSDSEQDYYAAMTVIAEVSAKKLDYMILDQLSMGFYAGQEVYMDLRKVFTEEELAEFAEKELLIYCMEEEEQEPWPAAIRINDLPYVKEHISSEGSVYFALSGSSEKYEQLRAVWEYIKAWEKE